MRRGRFSDETLNQGVYMHAKRSRVTISSHCLSSVDYKSTRSALNIL